MTESYKINHADTPANILEIQYDLYRRMSPAKKFEIICEAYHFGQSLAMAGIRMRFPDADDKQVRQIWLKEHLGEELYNKAYGSEGNE